MTKKTNRTEKGKVMTKKTNRTEKDKVMAKKTNRTEAEIIKSYETWCEWLVSDKFKNETVHEALDEFSLWIELNSLDVFDGATFRQWAVSAGYLPKPPPQAPKFPSSDGTNGDSILWRNYKDVVESRLWRTMRENSGDPKRGRRAYIIQPVVANRQWKIVSLHEHAETWLLEVLLPALRKKMNNQLKYFDDLWERVEEQGSVPIGLRLLHLLHQNKFTDALQQFELTYRQIQAVTHEFLESIKAQGLLTNELIDETNSVEKQIGIITTKKAQRELLNRN